MVADWRPDPFRHLDAQGSSLYVIDADRTSERRLSEGTSDWSPAWSPDGTRIAYSSDRDGLQELVAVDPSGGSPTVLAPDQEGEYPAWSPADHGSYSPPQA
jgi:Tol biopolymer transport system component